MDKHTECPSHFASSSHLNVKINKLAGVFQEANSAQLFVSLPSILANGSSSGVMIFHAGEEQMYTHAYSRWPWSDESMPLQYPTGRT